MHGCTALEAAVLWAATLKAPTTLPYDVGSLKIGREGSLPGSILSSLLVVGKLLQGIRPP